MTNRNSKYRQPRPTFGTRSINIDKIYADLTREMSHRDNLEREMDRVWETVKRYRYSRSAELHRISNEIGESNHRINVLITQLGNYRKTHPAMKLAYDFVTSEIVRNKKLLSEWRESIKLVERGQDHFINSRGIVHSDTRSARRYVGILQDKIVRYEKARQYLRRYI